jgi:hypothetical protein
MKTRFDSPLIRIAQTDYHPEAVSGSKVGKLKRRKRFQC